MVKKSNDPGLEKALAELRRRGVGGDETSPTVAALKTHLGETAETDRAIIHLLGQTADPQASEVLAAYEEKTDDKTLRKEIRRAFFRLAQRGVAIPARIDEKSSAPPLFEADTGLEGYLSSVDGGGGRLVWLAKPQAGSGVYLLQGVVRDREGLLQAVTTVLRRRELRGMAGDIKAKHGITMISVPWSYADRLLHAAYEQAKKAGRADPEQFVSWRAILNLPVPKDAPHPIYDKIRMNDLDEVRAGAWREDSKRLLAAPELQPWLLDEDWIAPYVGRLQEAQESKLVLNPLQKEERLVGIVRAAARELFTGEVGRIFARRMEDMALYFLETHRAEEAKLALAVALQLQKADLAGLDITFLTGLVQKSVTFYIGRAKQEGADESALIVKP